MYIYDFIQGLIIGGTLIIAIGPQNLFVIQQGLKKSYVFTVTLFCSLSDSLLIIIGIYLSNYIVQINPSIIGIIKVLGGIWLIFYGLNKVIKLNQIKDINKELKKIQVKYKKYISEVRGRGLFLGIDIIQKSNVSKPNKKLAKLLINHMRNQGILLSTDGPYDNVIKIKPPLVFTKFNVDQVCKNLETFFKKL